MTEQNSSADWLPPGWTAEVRVRKNGKKDKCYTDPSNGIKFFSKPEVFRYLNNIETNCSTSNWKREGSHSHKLSSINSPAITEQLNREDSRSNEQMTGNQSSKLVGVMKDDKTLESCTGREGTSVSVSCFNLPEATDLKQREKSDPGKLPEKLPENGVENPGNKRVQPRVNEKNKRKKPDLPRRASKRLAGIDVGPIPELKTNNRARQVAARRLDEVEAIKAENMRDSAAPEELAEKRETQNNADEKQLCSLDLPPGIERKADEESGSPINFSLKDLWMDPCIEFAIKTLTDAIPIEDENNKPEENPGPSLDLPFGDSWGDPCIEFAVKTLTGAIPVVDDLDMPDFLQQQLTSSSETKQDKGSESSNVSLRNVCHSDGSLHSSGDAGLRLHCEERSDEHQRRVIRG